MQYFYFLLLAFIGVVGVFRKIVLIGLYILSDLIVYDLSVQTEIIVFELIFRFGITDKRIQPPPENSGYV